ncbi:tetratricopeptide repeat protein [Kutzneria sp. CA-103260]|uniref:tetratricopeptide repeat protein n=1 Tax=Kutzneria sp. CA-103260 TaxID=2802641 RepID=UPI001BA93609|nr:hypothetical protein [Kutzneria sp. CA-103260]QUQ64569.1 XRE family transcriptional regulator [Kutzneria sp. CA-103260]
MPKPSQISDILNGRIKKVPAWEVVWGIVSACTAHAHHHRYVPDQIVDEAAWRLRHTLVQQILEMRSRQDVVGDTARATTGEPSGSGTTTQPTATRGVNQWRPGDLGLHPAISVKQPRSRMPLPELTPYVARPHDRELRDLLREPHGPIMVMLVGESSTGKTRCALEAVRSVLADWPVHHPVDAADLLNTITSIEQGTISDQCVVWLDEAQTYLDTVDGPTVAAGLRRLLRGDTTVVVLGTIWESPYWARLTATAPVDGHDKHAVVRGLLRRQVTRITVPAQFRLPTALEEGGENTTENMNDPRMRTAVSTARDGRVIQVLAGGVELARDYDHPEPNPLAHHARAVITAMMDIRRLGCTAPVTPELLCACAPAYLSAEQRATTEAQRDDWFARATADAQRPLHGVAALIAERHSIDMGAPDTYQLHDYLDQHGRTVRCEEPVPAAAWEAMIEWTTDARDLHALAIAAKPRGLFRYCLHLVLRLIRHEVAVDLSAFTDLLRRHAPDHVATAEHRSTSAGAQTWRQWFQLREQGEHVVQQLTELVDEALPAPPTTATDDFVSSLPLTDSNGQEIAAAAEVVYGTVGPANAWQFVMTALRYPASLDQVMNVATGRGEQAAFEPLLRVALANGHPIALGWLADLLHQQGRLREMESLLDLHLARHRHALGWLVDLLEEQDRLVEAQEILWAALWADHPEALDQLTSFLERHDRADTAIQTLTIAADQGAPHAAGLLIATLIRNGHDAEARKIVTSLPVDADTEFWTAVDILETHRLYDEVEVLLTRAVDHAHPHALSRLNALLLATGRKTDAEVLLSDNRDVYRDARMLLLTLYRRDGRIDSAELLLREVYLRESWALSELDSLLRDAGRRRDAETYLRRAVTVGHRYAFMLLVNLVSERGPDGEADRVVEFGLTVDGSTSPPWSIGSPFTAS